MASCGKVVKTNKTFMSPPFSIHIIVLNKTHYLYYLYIFNAAADCDWWNEWNVKMVRNCQRYHKLTKMSEFAWIVLKCHVKINGMFPLISCLMFQHQKWLIQSLNGWQYHLLSYPQTKRQAVAGWVCKKRRLIDREVSSITSVYFAWTRK